MFAPSLLRAGPRSDMFCEKCRKGIRSNLELRTHLLSEHAMTAAEYFRSYPGAQKFCSKCKRELPITEFFVDRNNRLGYRARCIHCMRPGGNKRECPLCHRIFQWVAVATHLQNSHGIRLEEGYGMYLKEKRCPKCGRAKSLDQFRRQRKGISPYFSYCSECNSDRLKTRTRTRIKGFKTVE